MTDFDQNLPLSTSFQPGAPLPAELNLKLDHSMSTQSTESIDGSSSTLSPSSIDQSIDFDDSFSSRLEGMPHSIKQNHPRTPNLSNQSINQSTNQSTKIRRREGEISHRSSKHSHQSNNHSVNQPINQSNDDFEIWQKLTNLKSLLNAGFITSTEYKDRKSQLIDEMTGTKFLAGAAAGPPSGLVAGAVGGAGYPPAGAGYVAGPGFSAPGGSSISNPTIPTQTTKRISDFNQVATPVVNQSIPPIIPRGPPDFSMIQSERATKYTYNLALREWNAQSVLIKLDPIPFSRGALRLVYHLQDLEEIECDDDSPTATPTPKQSILNEQSLIESDSSLSSSSSESLSHSDNQPFNHMNNQPKQTKSFVAKISMDPRDNLDREIYFRDVEIQTLAAYYADLFNEYSPPKLIQFVKASILRLEERESAPLCGVERYIEGTYRKWNNNFGFVSEDERNTPQAFSHFTYESSNHRLLICDIQGVSDCYTDPQCHSIDQDGIGGKGNLGQRGIDRFLQTHRCNAICRYLKLPSINANYSDLGTLPVTQYMSYEQVKVVNIQHFPRTAVSQSLLQPTASSTSSSSATTTPTRSTLKHSDIEDQQCKGMFCNIL